MIVLGCLAAGEGKDWSDLSDGCYQQSSSHLEKTKQDRNDRLGWDFFHRKVKFERKVCFACLCHSCLSHPHPQIPAGGSWLVADDTDAVRDAAVFASYFFVFLGGETAFICKSGQRFESEMDTCQTDKLLSEVKYRAGM